jgi:hypothetical protein
MSENRRETPQADYRSITSRDVRLLRLSLLGFASVGIVASTLLAIKTGGFVLDGVVVVIWVVGAKLNRRSFVTFPWTAVLCSFYPVTLAAVLFSPDVFDTRYWVTATRWHGPHLLDFVLAVWACVNICLIFRFHRMQKGALREGMPWQYSLGFLFGLTFLAALVLGLCKWYCQLSQPPYWAQTDALERRYGVQLARLAKAAYDYYAPSDGSAAQLFGADEIVSAFVFALPSGRAALEIKHGDVTVDSPRPGLLAPVRYALVRDPRLGHPVVNLWHGHYVEYRALLKDKNGVERGYSLTVDLLKMRPDNETEK